MVVAAADAAVAVAATVVAATAAAAVDTAAAAVVAMAVVAAEAVATAVVAAAVAVGNRATKLYQKASGWKARRFFVVRIARAYYPLGTKVFSAVNNTR